MTKAIRNSLHDDENFLVEHLVDSGDWVADHERTVCHVCTRAFGTFRRKHHCRMCGEVVCSSCTLHKNAILDVIGQTRVRVCVPCVFSYSQAPHKRTRPTARQFASRYSPNATTTSSSMSPTMSSNESHQWVTNHLHSPVSRSENGSNPEDEHINNNNHYQQRMFGNNQDEALEKQCDSWTHPWPKPPVAADEADRLRALHALEILDSSPEKPFDMICDLAKARLSCPMAAVGFLDEHRQWFKASVGLAHKMIPRKIAFCAYTVFTKEPVVVLDTLKDVRFDCNPLVSGAAEVRFYAAAPIMDPSTGHAVGSVFVLDTRPRESCDVTILERLAHAASENLRLVTPSSALKLEPQDDNDEIPIMNPEDNTDNQESFDDNQVLSPSPSTSSLPSTSSSSQLVVPSQSSASSNCYSSSSSLCLGTSASGEQMEVLLMRLLTQNTETQQQLAMQQISISNTLGQHSTQINKLMQDFVRMEARVEAKLEARRGAKLK